LNRINHSLINPLAKACPAFYLLKNSSLKFFAEFLEDKKDAPLEHRDAPGHFISWLIRFALLPVLPIWDHHHPLFLNRRTQVHSFAISRRFDIGNLADYEGQHRSSSSFFFGPEGMVTD